MPYLTLALYFLSIPQLDCGDFLEANSNPCLLWMYQVAK